MAGGTNLKCEDIPSLFPYHFTTSSRSSPFIFHRAVFDQVTDSHTSLFVFKLDTKFSFFSSPQLHNQNKKSSLVAPVGIYMMSLDFDGFTSGLIYFCSMYFSEKSGMGNSKPVIFNPSTQHYVSLPKPRRRSPQILGKLFRV